MTSDNIKVGFYIIGFIVVIYVAYNIYTAVKGGLDWWANLFGFLKPGTQIKDTTGQAGDALSANTQTETYNSSQGSYDVKLANYAKAQGLPTSLSAQGTSGWPWVSYDSWVSAGMPALP